VTTTDNLKAGLKDWRQHAISASLTLIPLVGAALVAWGALNAQASSTAAAVTATQTRLDGLDRRVGSVEQQNAAVLARLDDLRDAQATMNRKLDHLTESRR
jgi:hypothetical protein